VRFYSPPGSYSETNRLSCRSGFQPDNSGGRGSCRAVLLGTRREPRPPEVNSIKVSHESTVPSSPRRAGETAAAGFGENPLGCGDLATLGSSRGSRLLDRLPR